MTAYETIIGFEVHCEMSTNTKVFCGCSTRFGQPANTQTCPVCLGMPGSLPVLNKTALDYAIRTALALNCTVNQHTNFERKNYYYPDLPKNYQISQLRHNLGVNGWIDLNVDGQTKRIRINNIHLEEDAGKNVHPEALGGAEEYSLVDLNRAGTPLLEIVTEPDLRGVEDSAAYMNALKNLLEYIGVSDCNMHEGRLRFEVNISLRPVGQTTLPNYRSEIKNLGSMKAAVKVIEYEIKRQSRALDKGEKLIHDTRLWDEESGRTEAMRSKEQAHDYRYFPEPDLVDVEIDDAWFGGIRDALPELPEAKKRRFINDYGLPEYDAEQLTATRAMADYYETAVRTHPSNPKAISNWIMTELMRELNERYLTADKSPIPAEFMAAIVQMIDSGEISGKIGKDVFAEMMSAVETPGKTLDPRKIVEEKGWKQVRDTGAVEAFVEQAIAANPGPVEDYRSGKDKALGFLVGAVMKLSRGKANPDMVNEMLRKKIRGE